MEVSYRTHLARCMLGVAFLAVVPHGALAAEWPSALNLSTLNGSNGFRLDGSAAVNQSGTSVSKAGDVNGDGFADVIVGASNTAPNGAASGSSYVVFGKAGGFASITDLSSLNGSSGFRLDGVAAGNLTGRSVAAAGDVNGDGIGDLIVGAFGANSYSGSSYVVFGKAGGFASTINLSTLNSSNGFRLDGVAVGDKSGLAVSTAGDVNGDGFADLIVGAYGADNHGAYSGSSYVVFGKAGGFAPAINLATLTGTNGFRVDGVASGDFAGIAVSAAGDVNGDGLGDVIIGASGADHNGSYSGSSYVLFGKPGGFPSAIDLSALNGANGFRLDGTAIGDNSGGAVSGAGDVNGDGFGDVVVGAYHADLNGSNSGLSYVVFGKSAGFASAINLSALDGATGFRLDGVAALDQAGRAVHSAGDVNGDGFSDLIVGAPYADANGAAAGSSQGSSFVIFGAAGGFPSTINLSALNGASGLRLDGVTSADYAGAAASAAGDVNGDGFDDLIIGAHGASPHGSSSGSTYVVFGRAPAESALRIGSIAKQVIRGGPFTDYLAAVGPGDVLEGRGSGDFLYGYKSGTTASYAFAGSGLTANLAQSMTNTGDAAGDIYVSISNLEGSVFDDALTGDAKANVLTGGKGRDQLRGGKGKDVFAYRLAADSLPGAANSDLVLDFEPGTATSFVDKIDLSAIDANSSVGGNQAFTFKGTKVFNGAGQVRLLKSGANVIVQGNTGGTTAPEFEIVLKGMAAKIGSITAKDFKL